MSIQFISTATARHQGILSGVERAESAKNGHWRGGSKNSSMAVMHKFFTSTDRSSFPLLNRVMTEHENTVNSFLTGRASLDDVERSFESVFETLFKINIAKGVITADDYEAKGMIIMDTYHNLRLQLVNKVFRAHHTEGRNLAVQHGFHAGDRNPNLNLALGGAFMNWVHYNSDFYFMEEDMVSVLTNVAHRLLGNIGIENEDLDQRWTNLWGGAHNFNSVWHSWSNSQSSRAEDALKNTSIKGWMLDVRTSPPRGFSFFFGEQDLNPEEVSSAIRQLMILNGQLATREVSPDNRRFSLLDFWGASSITDDVMRSFLNNFEILR